jgi:hypothetical protein
MALTIRYKRFPWPGQRRPCDERLERRARALVEQRGWARDGPPGRFGQWLRRPADGGHVATLAVNCSPYGDWARLTLRGGPFLPPGYRWRRPHDAPRDPAGPETSDPATPPGELFMISPLAGFDVAPGPLADARSRSRAESVEPDEIAWPATAVPMGQGDEGLRVIVEYVDACLRDGEAWASATRIALRSRRYR